MNDADEALNLAIREAELLRKRTRKKKTIQVKGSERDIIRATALAWFKNHRPRVTTVFSDGDLLDIDQLYQRISTLSHRSAVRSSYIVTLKQVGTALVQLRSSNLVKLGALPQTPLAFTTDEPPDFASLILDVQMKAILERRWVECTKCIGAGAPLAATVMMGGLLEGLLLARVNREPKKTRIFTASAAPKDKQGQTRTLNYWTLQNYLAVAHELGWISQAVKGIGEVLRDYRNYIHPEKEFSEKVSVSNGDAALFWEISKNIARELLKGSP